MSTIYKGEVFYTSEELDFRLKSYIKRTSDDLFVHSEKKEKREAVV